MYLLSSYTGLGKAPVGRREWDAPGWKPVVEPVKKITFHKPVVQPLAVARAVIPTAAALETVRTPRAEPYTRVVVQPAVARAAAVETVGVTAATLFRSPIFLVGLGVAAFLLLKGKG